jgi:hypothetical protein
MVASTSNHLTASPSTGHSTRFQPVLNKSLQLNSLVFLHVNLSCSNLLSFNSSLFLAEKHCHTNFSDSHYHHYRETYCSVEWPYQLSHYVGNTHFPHINILYTYVDKKEFSENRHAQTMKRIISEAEFLDVIGPPSNNCLRLVCNVNIVYGNLKSENSQDYVQKPERNYTFMNSASGSQPGKTEHAGY